MRNRRVGLIGGALLLAALVLSGAVFAGIALGQAGSPPAATTGTTAGPLPGTPGPYGPYDPHGPYGPYGPYGGCPMCGSYGPSGPYPGTQGTPATGGTQVIMQNLAYQPANIQVRVGTTVTWVNQDTVAHTVTFRTSELTSSNLFQPGQSFRVTFTTPGSFDYYCAVHPAMVGTVTVTS